MADLVDRWQADREVLERAALSHRKPAGPAYTGHCLNCEAPVAAPLRWCNAGCRDDWQRLQSKPPVVTDEMPE